MSLVTLTSSGPFKPRQQGGLYVVTGQTQNVPTSLTTSAGTSLAQSGSLIIWGGEDGLDPNLITNDVWYSSTSTSWQTYQAVTIASAYNSESYGPTTCADPYRQVLYSIGGDLTNDRGGTNTIYYSLDLGQHWTQTQGAFPGRSNAACFVDSYSRVYVVGGKQAGNNDSNVSKDVWQAPLFGNGTLGAFTLQTSFPPFTARDGFSGATYYSSQLTTDIIYVGSGYGYNSFNAAAGDNGIGYNDGE